MLNRSRGSDRERERERDRGDSFVSTAWARAPTWLKGVAVIAVIAAVIIAVRHVAFTDTAAAQRDRERTAEVATLKTLAVEVPNPVINRETVTAKHRANVRRFDPSRGRRVFIDAGAGAGDSLSVFAEHGSTSNLFSSPCLL
jgi:hypothetical protein